MIKTNALPTSEVLHHFFAYCNDGTLRWKVRRRGIRVPIGAVAGDKAGGTNRYSKVSVPGHGRPLVHRLIWVMHHGPIPDGLFVDHIDRDKANNRIENLRLVTWSKNQRNTHAKNKTGLPKHVYLTPAGRYTVTIRVGTFDTIEEAAAEAAVFTPHLR